MTDTLPIQVTNREVKRFVELYEQGYSIREIQARTGRAHATIRLWLKYKKVKLRPRGGHPTWNAAMLAETRKMVEQGYTLATIGDQLGVSKRVVGKICEKLRINVSRTKAELKLSIWGRNKLRRDTINTHKNAIPIETQKQIRKLAKDGVPHRKIAKKLGCSSNTVTRYAPHKWIAPLKEKDPWD